MLLYRSWRFSKRLIRSNVWSCTTRYSSTRRTAVMLKIIRSMHMRIMWSSLNSNLKKVVMSFRRLVKK